MKIIVTQEVDIPAGPYCKDCYRLDYDGKGDALCTIFGNCMRTVDGNAVRCDDCIAAEEKATQP